MSEELLYEKSCGAVVYCQKDNDIKYLLACEHGGFWVFPKDNCNVVIGWMPIEQIQNMTIYPEFIKEEIYHLDGPMKHFVSKS